METTEVYIEEIGKVQFLRKSRNTRLKISVKPMQGVVVTIPDSIGYREAYKFVESKKDWLKKSIQKVNRFEQAQSIFDENTAFKSKFHELQIKRYDGFNVKFNSVKGKLHVLFPKNRDIGSAQSQQVIKRGVVWALRREAQHYLPKRVHDLANTHGFKFKQVFVKNVKTRWGSCSHVNNINLNIHLMRLPDELIDHVILHELTHTVHKNHGNGFWAHLEKVSPGTKRKEKELNKYRIEIY